MPGGGAWLRALDGALAVLHRHDAGLPSEAAEDEAARVAAMLGAPAAEPPGLRQDGGDPRSPAAAVPARPPAPVAAPAAAPVRLHLEPGPGGATLWLGLDAGWRPQAAPIAGAVQRWLAAEGVHMAGASCNGEALDMDASATAPAPAAPIAAGPRRGSSSADSQP
jgi:hypothetical protein